MKIRKIFTIVIVVLLVLIVLAAVVVRVAGNRVLRGAIETNASRVLSVPVTLEGVTLSVMKGSVELKDLKVGNPEGYQYQYLLELERGKVDVDIFSLLGDTVEIKEIHLDGIELVIEQKQLGLGNNLQEIMKSLPKAEDPDTQKEPVGKKLHIAKLEVTGVNVTVKLLPLPGQLDVVKLTLDPIVMEDLGSDNKIDTARLTGIVMTSIATGIAKKGAGVLPAEIIEPLMSIIQIAPEVIVETATEILEQGADIGEGLLKEGKDLTEGLKGLFKKKKD